jgi:hypothetical protein
LFIAIPFTLIGFFVIKPDLFVKYQIWSMKFFGFGNWQPSKRIYTFYRIFGLVFLIIGLVSLGMMFFQKPTPTNSPSIYASLKLTDDKLIFDNGVSPFNLYGVYETITMGGPQGSNVTHTYYCKDTGNEAEKIMIYNNPGKEGIKGGWSYRFAIVCGNNYWIYNAADSFGYKIYGPFAKNGKLDLKYKCCSECLSGSQPNEAAPMHCGDTSKMSKECIGYLKIQGLTGLSTADATAAHCLMLK